jgi:methylthioribulose-1-phosphate dehydratase
VELTGAGPLSVAAAQIVEVATGFHRRGWILGTSGNLSAVLERQPLRLAITASGLDKGTLRPEHILPVDGEGRVLEGRPGKASDETRLHLTLVQQAGAGSVLHTHSVWGTILSDAHASAGGVAIEGYEMLKGLAGVRTHEHREWVPILGNTQDYEALSAEMALTLKQQPPAHGILIRNHGLYAWGKDLAEARRHVEILEFLFEVRGRLFAAGGRPAGEV